jgi:hypothetical protein
MADSSFAPSGPAQRYHSRHEIARGVGAGRDGEGVAGVMVRGGNGLN